MSYAYANKKWSAMNAEEREKAGSKSAHKTAKEKAQARSSSSETETSAAQPAQQAQQTQQKTQVLSDGDRKTLARMEAKKAAEGNKVTAKDKASEYLRNHPNAGKGGTKDAGFEKILKEGGLNNGTYQKMVNADKKVQYDQAKTQRKEAGEAYRQSRIDLQQSKDAVGRRGVYEYQSAKDLQASKGGTYYNDLGGLSDNQKERNALIRTFRDSDYDYNHADVLRHMKGGAENKMFTGLYDDYGGYKDWYDNHSIYSGENAQQAGHVQDASLRMSGDNFDADYNLNLGNFTGSKDIIDRDEVMRQGGARQQAGKDFYNSNEFMEKYGQYDWAQQNKNNANASVADRQGNYFDNLNRNDQIRSNAARRESYNY